MIAYILANGMRDWEAAEWVVFFGGVATVFGALSAAIIAILKAGRAEAKSDTANDRISNVSRAQDTMRSDLTNVAKDTMSADVAAALMHASPSAGQKGEKGDKGDPGTTTPSNTPVPVKLVEALPDAVVSTIDKPKS